MVQMRAKIQRTVTALLKELSLQELRETADFALFLRTRSRIDPTQSYFWSRQWQAKERRIQRDKRLGRLLGDGTVASLLRTLKS